MNGPDPAPRRRRLSPAHTTTPGGTGRPDCPPVPSPAGCRIDESTDGGRHACAIRSEGEPAGEAGLRSGSAVRGRGAAQRDEARRLLSLAVARGRGLRDLPLPRVRKRERAPLLRLPAVRGGRADRGQEGEGLDPRRVPVLAPDVLTTPGGAAPSGPSTGGRRPAFHRSRAVSLTRARSACENSLWGFS